SVPGLIGTSPTRLSSIATTARGSSCMLAASASEKCLLDRGRSRRQGRQRSSLLSSASDRLPGVIALEFAPGQCQVLPLNRLPFAHFATGELTFFIRDRRRFSAFPFANHAFI